MESTDQTAPDPVSPTTSTSSYSIITSQLDTDTLSQSTNSLDLISHPSSSSQSGSISQDVHSRESSSSVAGSQPDIEYPSGISGNEDDDDDYEVILVPRSLSSSITGGSLSNSISSSHGLQSIPDVIPEIGGDVEEGNPTTPQQPNINLIPDLTETLIPTISPVPEIRNIVITAEQARWEERKARKAIMNRAKKERKEAEAKSRAEAAKQSIPTQSSTSPPSAPTSEADSGSLSGVTSDDLVKVEKKGNGKKWRGGEKARKRREEGRIQAGNIKPSQHPAIWGKGESSSTIRSRQDNHSVLDDLMAQAAKGLSIGSSGSSTIPPPPPAPISTTASLQKLHLLELLNNGGGSVPSMSDDSEDSDEDETEAGDDEDRGDDEGQSDKELYNQIRGQPVVTGPVRRQWGRRNGTGTGSILSSDDAKSSIDE